MSEETSPIPSNAAQKMLREASAEELVDSIVGLAMASDDESLATLRELLRTCVADPMDLITDRNSAVYSRVAVPLPVLLALALVRRGPPGVRTLTAIAPELPTGLLAVAQAVSVLWFTAHGYSSELRDIPVLNLKFKVPEFEDVYIDEQTAQAAETSLRGLLADSLTDDRALSTVTDLLAYLGQEGSDRGVSWARQLLDGLLEAAIRLGPSVIGELQALIEAELPEERYQRFLAHNPVFLDPLAAEVIPKQKLGLEHVTDFALRRHDGRWVLVEIEKPQDPIFTRRTDFSASFTHAFGQILDFQRWIEVNAVYAQNRMPGIASPRGLLVMGRRPRTDDTAAKLRRFATNSVAVDVLTYDDLVSNAQTLLRSLHYA